MEGAENEVFVDVPDTIDALHVLKREQHAVTIAWPAPCSNARAILQYEVWTQAHHTCVGDKAIAVGPLVSCGPAGEDGHGGLSRVIDCNDITEVKGSVQYTLNCQGQPERISVAVRARNAE
eukprot:71594-Amphidinium_carterae.1